MAGADVFSSNTAFPGGGGGGGLTNWTDGVNTTAPNATTPVATLTATNAATDVDAAIIAKGNGATLAQIPDNLVAGGNKRGIYATDFQKLRTVNSQVASGQYSAILGGYQNYASGQYSVAVGGTLSGAGANYSFVGSGYENQITGGATGAGIASGVYNKITATGLYSFIGGGGNNTLASRNEIVTQSSFIGGGHTNRCGPVTGYSYQTIGGGASNSTNNDYATICGGLSNSVQSSRGFIGGGAANTISVAGSESVIAGGSSNQTVTGQSTISGGVGNRIRTNATSGICPGGNSASIEYQGELGFANGTFSANPSSVGNAQTSFVTSRRVITAGAAATELTFDENAPTATNTIVLTTSAGAGYFAYQFQTSVVAVDTVTSGQVAWWNIVGGIGRFGAAATTTLIGANVVDTGNAGGNSAGWTCVVGANTTLGSLAITVSAPAAGGSVRFVATTRLTRVVSQ